MTLQEFRDALETLRSQPDSTKKPGDSGFDIDESKREYMSLREQAVELLSAAHEGLKEQDFDDFKAHAIQFFCERAGSHLDLMVLNSASKDILSAEDVQFIRENSSLRRWL